MSPLLEAAALTHPGKVRSHNEDCIAADARLGYAVLADGMGGHNAGEVASQMAVELLTARLASHCNARSALDAARAEALIAEDAAFANAVLLEASRTNAEYDGMGTTLVAALWHRDGVTFGNVGDSRLYMLRRGELRQLTRDHSIVQEELECGAISAEDARFAPNRNVLTRAVGIDPDTQADVRTCAVEADDLYLLCSDGLTDMLTDDEVRETLVSCRGRIGAGAQRLVERANQSGGLDNISVIVVRVVGFDAGAGA